MKLISTLLLASGLAAWAQTEEQIHKQFTVHPGGKLIVDVDFGSIEVGTNANPEVAVDVSRKVMMESKAEEEAFLADRPVEISQQGDTVTVHSRAVPGAVKPHGRTRTQAKYQILVPATCQAHLQTGGGGISVSDLSAKVKASTSGGSLAFAHLRGDLDGKTSGGSIRLRDCEGAQKVNTSGGSIESDGGSGKLEGDTSGGRITVMGFRGPVRVETTGGGLTFKDVAGR